MYKGSPAIAVMTEYSEHSWKPWRFQTPPRFWWKRLIKQFLTNKDEHTIETLREIIKELEERMGILDKEDWYSVSYSQLGKAYYIRLCAMGGLHAVLSAVHPDHDWDQYLLAARGKAVFQSRLATHLSTLFEKKLPE